MTGKRNTKPIDGVSFSEFARLIDRSKGYISQMKSADRLVLTADGKRVLVDESITKLKATKDLGKWPLTVYHQQARDKKRSDAKSQPETELISDPYEAFLTQLFSDAMPYICAELIEDSDASLREAADAYLAVCCAIDRTRAAQGYTSRLSVTMISPVELAGREEWKKEKCAEIEKLVSEAQQLYAIDKCEK